MDRETLVKLGILGIIVGIIAGILTIILSLEDVISTIEYIISIFIPFSRITIQGLVVDEDNNPVSGALVTIDGQTCLTNSNGDYTIQDVTEGIRTIEVKSAEREYRNVIIVRNGDGIMKYDALLITKPP